MNSAVLKWDNGLRLVWSPSIEIQYNLSYINGLKLLRKIMACIYYFNNYNDDIYILIFMD